MPQFIALDIGNVCVRVEPEQAFARLGMPDSQSVLDAAKRLVFELETGKIGEKEWIDGVSRLACGRFSEEELVSAYNSIIGDEIPGFFNLLDDLIKCGFKAVFFSDTSRIHITHFFKMHRFPALAHSAVFSFDVGARKPDTRMFESFETEFGVPALYIDDRDENVQAGRKRGWPSIIFSSVEELEKDPLFIGITGTERQCKRRKPEDSA